MLIQEAHMYYFWQFQYFRQNNLTTITGEPLKIVNPGTRNENAGPDFLYAHVKIGNIDWYGHIELHKYASAWYAHAHHHDLAYENVVLHVIWYNDKAITRKDQTHLPTLLLASYVDLKVMKNCEQLMTKVSDIYCTQHIASVTSAIRRNMLDKMLRQRLQRKQNNVYQLLANNDGDWEETTYQVLAYNLGFSINSEAMLDVCKSVSYKIIRHERDNIAKIEALLFGQAGLLTTNELDVDSDSDTYKIELRQYYTYLTHKYKLSDTGINKLQWKFFRLRPANFPTVRIAQLAQLLFQHDSLFSWLLDNSLSDISSHLAVSPSKYWQDHYVFGKKSKQHLPVLGKTSINTIVINTVVPLLMAYSKIQDSSLYRDKAIAILYDLPPEDNVVIRKWKVLGMDPAHAFDSQALIELYHYFCKARKCLSCSIGHHILKN